MAATVIADRCSGDGALLDPLDCELVFGCGIRIRGYHDTTDGRGERRKAQACVCAGGRVRTLRQARLIDGNQYPVATAVCGQDKGMKNPWCPTAVDAKASAKALWPGDAQRRGIEASGRNIKGLRFGTGIKAPRISKPERRDRLLRSRGLAIAWSTVAGAAVGALGHGRLLDDWLLRMLEIPRAPHRSLCRLASVFALTRNEGMPDGGRSRLVASNPVRSPFVRAASNRALSPDPGATDERLLGHSMDNPATMSNMPGRPPDSCRCADHA